MLSRADLQVSKVPPKRINYLNGVPEVLPKDVHGIGTYNMKS